MWGKGKRLTRKVETALPSGLQVAIFLLLVWLAEQLGIYERGGGVAVLGFALVVLVVGSLFVNYVRRRFWARGTGGGGSVE
jgi:hypothetical protein